MSKMFVLLLIVPLHSKAFISGVLDIKKEINSYVLQAKEGRYFLKELETFKKLEEEIFKYEEELENLSKELKALEEIGSYVEDLKDFTPNKKSSLKNKMKFFNDYIKRAKSFFNVLETIILDNDSIIASQSFETNRVLRALLKESQAKDIRDLREKVSQKRKKIKKEGEKKEFVKNQYAYMNKHQKTLKFNTFHPFKRKKESFKKKRKKFLGVF